MPVARPVDGQVGDQQGPDVSDREVTPKTALFSLEDLSVV
jgi:hypothetical protein